MKIITEFIHDFSQEIDRLIDLELSTKSSKEIQDIKDTVKVIGHITRAMLTIGVFLLVVWAYLQLVGMEIHIIDKGMCCYACSIPLIV